MTVKLQEIRGLHFHRCTSSSTTLHIVQFISIPIFHLHSLCAVADLFFLSLCILGININSVPKMVTDLWTFVCPIGYNGKIEL